MKLSIFLVIVAVFITAIGCKPKPEPNPNPNPSSTSSETHKYKAALVGSTGYMKFELTSGDPKDDSKKGTGKATLVMDSKTYNLVPSTTDSKLADWDAGHELVDGVLEGSGAKAVFSVNAKGENHKIVVTIDGHADPIHVLAIPVVGQQKVAVFEGTQIERYKDTGKLALKTTMNLVFTGNMFKMMTKLEEIDNQMADAKELKEEFSAKKIFDYEGTVTITNKAIVLTVNNMMQGSHELSKEERDNKLGESGHGKISIRIPDGSTFNFDIATFTSDTTPYDNTRYVRDSNQPKRPKHGVAYAGDSSSGYFYLGGDKDGQPIPKDLLEYPLVEKPTTTIETLTRVL